MALSKVDQISTIESVLLAAYKHGIKVRRQGYEFTLHGRRRNCRSIVPTDVSNGDTAKFNNLRDHLLSKGFKRKNDHLIKELGGSACQVTIETPVHNEQNYRLTVNVSTVFIHAATNKA